MVEHHLPLTHAAGLALAVTDDHDTLGAVVRGFAEVAGGRGVRPETRFQIGSISKSWAALCVLQEEAKGTLALDVSINEILPWLGLPEPFGPITMHDLLTHTSGLMIGVEHAPWSRIDALRARDFPATMAARRAVLVFEPRLQAGRVRAGGQSPGCRSTTSSPSA